MAELACSMVYVYLAGAWSWLGRASAEREGLPFRACAKRLGHEGAHMPSLEHQQPALPPRPAGPDPERDRRRAAYAQRERARARRFLDEWFRAVAAGVSATTVLADLFQCMADYSASDSHHKSNYGVSAGPLCVHGFIADGQACGEYGCTEPADPHPGVPCWQLGPDCGHSADYVAPDDQDSGTA